MQDDFDFWVGEWTVRWADTEGRNTVTKRLNERVIVEEFDGRPGTRLRGLSVSVFDSEARVWRQTWVDNEGGYLEFRGGPSGRDMDLRRHGDDGWYRMLWKDIQQDSLVWLWQRSPDEKKWETLWRLDYERRQSGAGSR